MDPVAWDSYDGIPGVVVGDSKTDVLGRRSKFRFLLVQVSRLTTQVLHVVADLFPLLLLPRFY